MNLRTIVLSLILSGGALALAPPASAADAAAADPCRELQLDGGILFGARVDYDPANNTCHVWLGVIDGHRLCSAFADMQHQQIRRDVGVIDGDRETILHLVINYCAPVIYCTCDPIETPLDHLDDGISTSPSMAPPYVCVREPCYPPYPYPPVVWCRLEAATPTGEPHLSRNPREIVWGTDPGCDIDVETHWHCLYNEVPVDRSVGPVHVSTRVCTPPDFIEPASASMAPPIYCIRDPCYPPYPFPPVTWCRLEAATPTGYPYLSRNPREMVWGTDEGCDIDADTTQIYACAPPSGFVIEKTVGPAHVVLLVCDGGAGIILDRIGDILREVIATE
jgi:hypothetical protein